MFNAVATAMGYAPSIFSKPETSTKESAETLYTHEAPKTAETTSSPGRIV